MSFDHVDYSTLDSAKNAFISASRRTLTFAQEFGFVPSSDLGASANVFSLNLAPFLKSGTDNLSVTLIPEGLGTADDARPEDLSTEELSRFWFNIGIKTVSVMTNDAASSGMQTILIGLYLPSSTPETVFTKEFMNGFLDGFVEGCKRVKCVYFSGETPQLKTKIYPGKLDIAGALFGVVPPGFAPISGGVKAGDKIVLVASSGPHENGFTTLRQIAGTLPRGYRTDIGNGTQYWEAINAPSCLYTPLVQALMRSKIAVSNVENITGHGWQKIMRPKGAFNYHLHSLLPPLPVFEFVQRSLGISALEMVKVFNYGAGLAVFVPDNQSAENTVKIAREMGFSALVAGEVRSSPKRMVTIEPWNEIIAGDEFQLVK